MSDVPRRIQQDLMEPAELAILLAVQKVEELGADPKLTDAVVLLAQAQALVSDFIDLKQG
jgi:hypothetical protein